MTLARASIWSSHALIFGNFASLPLIAWPFRGGERAHSQGKSGQLRLGRTTLLTRLFVLSLHTHLWNGTKIGHDRIQEQVGPSEGFAAEERAAGMCAELLLKDVELLVEAVNAVLDPNAD